MAIASVGRARRVAEHVPDFLPVLALLAAAIAHLIPSAEATRRVDVLLAVLVLVTALDIDPRQLPSVGARLRPIVLLAVLPLIVLAAAAWGIAQTVHGDVRDGVLALGVAPAEVASVGLIGLIGGAAELAIAVLALSLVLSAIAGPPILAVLGNTAYGAHGAHVAPLLGRFALVVIVPLVAGLLLRGWRPELARRELELSVCSCLIVVLLIYASVSGTHGGELGTVTLVSAAFLAVSALLAAGAATAFRTRLDPSVALTIGMRDFAVAAALGAGAFGSRAAEVPGIYGTLMLIAGAIATAVIRRAAAAPERQAGAQAGGA
jgi:predicted Na+-dependent transporter